MLRRFLKISVALGAIGSLALAALLAFLWCEHTRPLVLPVPTGHFAVGRATYTWVNDAVSELLSPSGAEKETIVAWMWYPARLSTQSQHAEYFPSAWQAALAHRSGVPFILRVMALKPLSPAREETLVGIRRKLRPSA